VICLDLCISAAPIFVALDQELFMSEFPQRCGAPRRRPKAWSLLAQIVARGAAAPARGGCISRGLLKRRIEAPEPEAIGLFREPRNLALARRHLSIKAYG